MAEPTGPLSTVNEEAIAAAFEADPMTLDDATLDLIVTELRRRRNAFLAAEAAKQIKKKDKERITPEPLTAAQQAVVDKPPSEITLDDIFGED